MRKIFYLFVLLLLCASCNEEHVPDIQHNDSDGMFLRLHEVVYAGAQTRSSEEPVRFDRLEHYVINEDGSFTSNIRSLYNASISQIKVEGLKDGKYELLVLAVKGNSEEDGVVIHDLETSSSPWLTFEGEASGKPLQAEYYYVRHSFAVSDKQVVNQDVHIQRIIGKIEFNVNYASDYVRKTTVSVDVIPSSETVFCTILNADGTLSGSRNVENFSLIDQRQFLLLPSGEGSALKGTFVLKTRNHLGEELEQFYKFDVPVRANECSQVDINVIHPDDNIGTLYVTDKDYTEENFSTILSDSEPKSVYYDNTQRSFNVNAPLQLKMIDGHRLHFLFYSPVAISGVRVFAKTVEMREFVEVAYLDHLPAFADATFELTSLGKKDVTYRTESGQLVKLNDKSWENVHTLETKVFSDDPYWQKISRIRAKWFITFNSYGANPDLPNGGVNGNWMGMRPVHAREALAALTNIAYLCTLEDFHERLMSFQGRVMGNDGVTPVDMSTIVPRLESHSRFNTGLVYVGNGVVGLGGGATWGVSQSTFFNHYTHTGPVTTMFHELGHCMGYNHTSGMTYGLWAKDCVAPFYVDNISRLPVNSKSILNSLSNPNRY